MALIDTHALIEEMIAAGIKKDQAVILTKAINQSNNNLVTKSDLKLEINKLKNNLEERIVKADNKFDSLSTKVDTDMKWIMTIGVAIFLMLAKLTFFNS
jgi:hypothetical protein